MAHALCDSQFRQREGQWQGPVADGVRSVSVPGDWLPLAAPLGWLSVEPLSFEVRQKERMM